MKSQRYDVLVWLTVMFGITALALPATATADNWRLSGYVRQYLSWNLEDVPETPENDVGDLQMNRQMLFLDVTGTTGPLRWTGRFRASHEILTDYEEKLEDSSRLAGLFGFGNAGFGADLNEEYNEVDIRELFFDWDLTDRIFLRFGRQQVVWGETDFFHATDVIHGFDLRWRNFYVPENEDVRKPLIIANATVQVPELNGALQVVVRPGLDDHDWIGDSIPTFGGRWSAEGGKGFNLASQNHGGLARFNTTCDDCPGFDADADDPHYGVRWTGSLGRNAGVDYSLSYYHGQGGFQQSPILIFNPARLATFPTFPLEFVYPETDTFGASATGYIAALDTVYRAEFAYTPDRDLATLTTATPVENDAWNFVLGFDTNPRLQNLIHTSSPSLLTVQIFDWFLPGVTERDDIASFYGAGPYDEHNLIFTSIFDNPFLNDRLKMTFVGIADLTQGGGWFIPSVQYDWGPHWRFKVELDWAIGGNYGIAGTADRQSVSGTFENNTQLLTRITFLF